MSDRDPTLRPWTGYPTHAGERGHRIGAEGPKVDGLARITGRARFVDDLKLPRTAHAKLVRSPHPHARIVRIDLSAALAIPGVLGAMTGEDLPKKYGAIPVAQDETALAIGKVRYVGEPVVAVAAIDEETAHRACRAVVVEYDVLEPVLTIEDALADGAPLVHEEARKATNVLRRVQQSYGDVDAALASADVVVEDVLTYPGSTHVPLEPHAALATWEDGKLTLWSSTQNPHYVHKDVARVLGVPEKDVRLVKPAVGAGYGGKCDPFVTDLCSAYLARKLERPVKMALEREEVFYAHRGRHPTRMRCKLGMRKDGTIAGVDLHAIAAGGAYASYGVVTAYYLGVFLTLPYDLKDVRFETMRLYTNEPPCGPKRGHGAIQPRFAVEALIDRAARQLGLDPAEVRRKNAIGPGHETVNGLVVGSCGVRECIDKVVEASGYRPFASGASGSALGTGRGRGLASSAYMCGALHPVHQDEMSQSSVTVQVDRSGAVAVFSGTADIGQGSAHLLALLVAERLGVDPKDVRVVDGDTGLTPVDLGSYSSRVTFMAGNAAISAVDQVRAPIVAAVASKLGVAPEDVELAGGRAFVRQDPEKGVPFQDAVRLAEESTGPIAAIGGYKPPKIGNRFRRQSVGPSPAYSFTAQVAEVSVDLETGEVTVDKIWVAHDCGRALAPTVVRGQIEGCVYMGLGEALYEEQTYRDGRMKTPSILEYKIPTVHEMPEIEVHLVETHEPGGPFGAKEVGEGPQLPVVPAIANAIAEAIGVWPGDPPYTPDRVLKAIESARGRR